VKGIPDSPDATCVRPVLVSKAQEVLEKTAYHEAGHAVMAHLCGQIVMRVEVCGDAEHSGSVSSLRFRGQPRWAANSCLPSASYEARILCLVAGLAAETIATGRTTWKETDDDLNEAVRLALRIVGSCDRVLAFLELAHDHAVELLRRHWSAVEVVADELLCQGNLAGEDLRRLLAPVLEEDVVDSAAGRVA